MKRVAVLLRVSTERQGAEDDIPVQNNECEKYAIKQGWTIVEKIVEKVSGYNTPIDKRDDLLKVKELAFNNQIDILLVYHSDRIGRQTEMVGVVTGLIERGVEVYSVKEGKIGGGEHVDTLMTFMKFWTAEGESRKTSEKVIDALEKYNEDGLYTGGKMPFGYKLFDTGEKINSKKLKTIKKLVIDEEEAKIVRYIFKLVIEKGMGGSTIAKHLNNSGYDIRGSKFRHSTITRILRNPVYMGYKRYNATIKKGVRNKQRSVASREEWKLQPFNPEICIVKEEDFRKVQNIMDKRKSHKDDKGCNPAQSTGSKYALLSGLVYCHCGCKLTTNSQWKKRVRKDGSTAKTLNVRYRCNQSSNVEGHGKRYWGNKNIDSKVEKRVLSIMNLVDFDGKILELSDEINKTNAQLEKELKTLEGNLKKKELAFDNAQKELELILLGESELTKEQVASLMNKINKDIEEITSKKNEIQHKIENNKLSTIDVDVLKETYRNWDAKYLATDHQGKQAMLSNVINKVILHEDSIDVIFDFNFMDKIKSSNPVEKIEDELLEEGRCWVSDLHDSVCFGVTQTRTLDEYLNSNYKSLKYKVELPLK